MKFALYTTALIAVSSFAALDSFAEGSAQSFMTDAIQGNLAEVSMGKLAQENSSNPGVKKFGATLRTDHSNAYRDAVMAAQSMGQEVPTAPSDAQQAKYNKLQQLRGVQFDQAFIEAMIEDHQNDIKMYEKAAKAKDGAASEYAATTLPHLRQHLATASKLAGSR